MTPRKPDPELSGMRVCCTGLLLLSICSGCTTDTPSLLIGYAAGEPNTPVANALVQVLRSNDVDASLEKPFESAEELTAAVEGGALDAAIIEEPLAPNRNLAMLTPLLPRVLHVLHHKSMNNPSLQQLLAASSIFAGQPNSMGRAIIRRLAQHHQINDLSARLLDTPWVPAPGQPPQVYFIFGGLLSAEARRGFADYRIFSFDQTSASSAAALELLFPNLREFSLPAGIYPDLTSTKITTVAVETLLVSRPNLNAQVAYRIAQTLYEQSQLLESAYALSRETLSATPTTETVHTLSMHPGARRFANKDAPSLLERYAEVFALAATLVLGLGTAVTTGLRQRRQRRKDRLDEYFLRLHALRTRLHGQTAQTAQTVQTANDADVVDSSGNAEVAALEAEVLQLLVEERLAVDAALVAFFLMSESVRREFNSTGYRSRG